MANGLVSTFRNFRLRRRQMVYVSSHKSLVPAYRAMHINVLLLLALSIAGIIPGVQGLLSDYGCTECLWVLLAGFAGLWYTRLYLNTWKDAKQVTQDAFVQRTRVRRRVSQGFYLFNGLTLCGIPAFLLAAFSTPMFLPERWMQAAVAGVSALISAISLLYLRRGRAAS